MGGFAALNALATGLKVNKAILMAPCDQCYRYFYDKTEFLSALSIKAQTGYFRLESDTAWNEEFIANAEKWCFPNLVTHLPKNIPYYFIGGMRDTVTPPDIHIHPVMEHMKRQNFQVEYYTFDDDHSFRASRLRLAGLVVKLLIAD